MEDLDRAATALELAATGLDQAAMVMLVAGFIPLGAFVGGVLVYGAMTAWRRWMG